METENRSYSVSQPNGVNSISLYLDICQRYAETGHLFCLVADISSILIDMTRDFCQ